MEFKVLWDVDEIELKMGIMVFLLLYLNHSNNDKVKVLKIFLRNSGKKKIKNFAKESLMLIAKFLKQKISIKVEQESNFINIKYDFIVNKNLDTFRIFEKFKLNNYYQPINKKIIFINKISYAVNNEDKYNNQDILKELKFDIAYIIENKLRKSNNKLIIIKKNNLPKSKNCTLNKVLGIVNNSTIFIGNANGLGILSLFLSQNSILFKPFTLHTFKMFKELGFSSSVPLKFKNGNHKYIIRKNFDKMDSLQLKNIMENLGIN